MPRFTLVKHSDNEFDTDVTMEFSSETVELARTHYDDFLKASGFEIPIERDHAVDRWLDQRDAIVKEEDWMWNDAFAAKFAGKPDNVVDFGSVIKGGEGTDTIPF